MQDIVFSNEYRNERTVKLVEISKKYYGIGDRGLCTIFICSNLQAQLWKQLQCRLKCNMLQQTVVLLFCRTLVFEVASSCNNSIAAVFLAIFGAI